MHRRIALFLMIVLSAPQLFAGWLKLYGERGERNGEDGYGVALSPDGGYAVVGETGLFGFNTWLLKTDSLGDTLWTRSYAFTSDNRSGNGYCIKTDQRGGYIIAGYASIPPDQGSYQLFLMRTDDSGDTLWVKFYGTENKDRGYWVCQTADGGYAATGFSNEGIDSPRRLFLVRTDSDGDTLWTRQYGGEGGMEDWGQCVEQTPDGGFIVTGYTKSFSQYEDRDVWLLRTDSEGDTLWTRTFGAENWDGGHQVIVTKDGGFVIAGIYDLTGSMVPTSGDVLLIKTDSAGNLEWQKTYGMTGGFVDQAYGVEQTSDGGYIVTGSKYEMEPTYYNLWLLKTDSLGDTLWTRTFGGYKNDYGRSVHQTPDGGYIICGSTNSYSEEVTDSDILLIKTDSLGYVSIEESSSVFLPPSWDIASPVTSVGGQIILRYENYPKGFRASVYDATGRKVDSIQSSSPSGSITWGTGQNAGVYIIREEGGTRAKVVLVK